MSEKMFIANKNPIYKSVRCALEENIHDQELVDIILRKFDYCEVVKESEEG